MEAHLSNRSALEPLGYAIARQILRRLPPPLGPITYSFVFLLAGLIRVAIRAVVELCKFFTGQIPQSHLFWPIIGEAQPFVRNVADFLTVLQHRAILECLYYLFASEMEYTCLPTRQSADKMRSGGKQMKKHGGTSQPSMRHTSNLFLGSLAEYQFWRVFVAYCLDMEGTCRE